MRLQMVPMLRDTYGLLWMYFHGQMVMKKDTVYSTLILKHKKDSLRKVHIGTKELAESKEIK